MLFWLSANADARAIDADKRITVDTPVELLTTHSQFYCIQGLQ